MRALRPVLLCLLLAVPAVALRLTGTEVAPGVALLTFGIAVVASSFVLAWAAEAAEVDIAGGLAIAVLAVIAVLPEYAVDLYFAYTAGSRPEYVQFAAANMTGSNRLLLGLGWSLVVLLALYVARRRTGRPVKELVLDPAYRIEIGFLALASLLALVVPATGEIHLWLGLVLLGVFVFYLVRMARSGSDDEHDLVGPAARIGALPTRTRRITVVAMFVVAALVILASAEPFADALVHSGQALGIDQFLLVQWLAPLSSEAPELIIAMIFALRGKGGAALGLLVSAKVNQWTLLVGSLPIAYLAGGGSTSLVLDSRQVEEFALTVAQTLMGIAVLITLRFPRWAAWTLLALFGIQFGVPGTGGRLVLTGVYLVLATVALVINRHSVLPTLAAPFRRTQSVVSAAAADVRELQPSGSAGR
ncbi:sodium/calcium exchanger protein [Microlunatus antarcticus]|uniref:Cation:H+ antiporter n=1 Tax=Microlunatus antarcticus TaxID=53388 RepID=A0A7W5P6C2_9ACTN|nr:sodium:proton exchanger [Microlunatus antarcticus]MBB3325671.1 cation:H+ antiporter [Microlunatus antarcticus]